MTPEKRHRIETIGQVAKDALASDERAKQTLALKAADILWLVGLAAQEVSPEVPDVAAQVEFLQISIIDIQKKLDNKIELLDDLAEHVGVDTHEAILPNLQQEIIEDALSDSSYDPNDIENNDGVEELPF